MQKTSIISLICLLVFGCAGQNSSSPQATDTLSFGVDSNAMRTRGLAAAPFSFQDSFPALYGLVKSDASVLQGLTAYAEQVVQKGGLTAEPDFVRLFETRETWVIPRLSPLFENMGSPDTQEAFDRYENELRRLGVSQHMAEGQITGLGPAPVLEQEVKAQCSEDFQLYLSFIYADSESANGEYPFLDMSVYQQMVVAGEKLMARKGSPWFGKIEDRFYSAVEAMMDVHFVRSENQNTRELPSMIVGGVSTEAYPGTTDQKDRSAFIRDNKTSQYSAVMRKILENPSEIGSTPESIYLIVTQWENEEKLARRDVQRYLSSGKDVPHYLIVRRGDGKDHYAITYRFFDEETKAEAALKKCKISIPEAELVMVSVNNGELYEVGPGN